MNIYFRLSGLQSSSPLIHFRYGPNTVLHQSVAQYLSDMWLSTVEIGVTQIRSFTEIAPKSPFLCVNRSPIRYGFRTDAKAILYSVNIALVF